MVACGRFAPYAGFPRRAMGQANDNILLWFAGALVVWLSTAAIVTLFKPTSSDDGRILLVRGTFGCTWLLYGW